MLYSVTSSMKANDKTRLDFAADVDFDQILTNPILDIAARFWDSDRYRAFTICYRSMRAIDDLVDDRKTSGAKISAGEAADIARMIDDWLESMCGGRPRDSFDREFLDVRDRFAIPLWPWKRLRNAMVYDIQHDGYRNFLTFLRYTEGAAVAPAAIFTHLCGVRQGRGGYERPVYDIRWSARPLAVFSYLVHIIRDFQKDARRDLNYFALDMLGHYSLTVEDLSRIARGGQISPSFRGLIGRYRSIAEYYRQSARKRIDSVIPCMLPRYQLSMEIIYALYHQIFERIDPDNGTFSGPELMPSAGEVKARLELTLERFSPVEN